MYVHDYDDVGGLTPLLDKLGTYICTCSDWISPNSAARELEGSPHT